MHGTISSQTELICDGKDEKKGYNDEDDYSYDSAGKQVMHGTISSQTELICDGKDEK